MVALRCSKRESSPVRVTIRVLLARFMHAVLRWTGVIRFCLLLPLILQCGLAAEGYVGAVACGKCHRAQFDSQSKTGHAHAYEHLAEKGRPIAVRPRKGESPLSVGRQFDPECARCHTTGFEFKTGFETAEKTPHLFGNQCENCHGPASLHVADPKNVRLYAPLRLSINTVEDKCRKCHDGDNDPKFDLWQYWPKIKHGREQ